MIWSTTPLAIKWSGEEVGFLFGVTGRMVLGAVVGLMLARLLGVKLPWHTPARQTYLAAGFGLFLGMLSVYWSSQFIPSGWISIIFGLAPIMTGVMATLWLSENALTPARIAGMALGLAGLAFIFSGGEALGPEAGYGIAGVLLSVFVHSATAVAVKRIGADLSALAVTTGGLLVAVPLYLAVFVMTGEPMPSVMPVRPALSIIYLGLVGSVLGFVLYFYVLRHVEATRVALITLVTPVMALVLGNSFNGESVQLEIWGGTAAILSGFLLYEYGSRLGGWIRKTATVELGD
jgi:drug/metabolite transporter (DMT)-like permease